MAIRFDAELAHATRELSRVRTDIAHSDAIALSAVTAIRERSAAHRATAYVWLASVIESTVRAALRATLREISALAIPSNQIRVSLFSLLCDADFSSIATRGRQAAWGMKMDTLARLLEDRPAVFSEDVLPLDGRTIRAEHFDTIWLVLGLSGTSLPSARHRFALKDLAEGRNEVAHGHSDPVTFGRTKATSDIIRLIDHIDEVITHFLICLDDYLLHKQFIR